MLTVSEEEEDLYSVHRTSDQHVELGSIYCNRDVGDLNTILKWLAQPNPFDIQRPELRSLSSGLSASDGDGVNCDEVEEVASLEAIQVLRNAIFRKIGPPPIPS